MKKTNFYLLSFCFSIFFIAYFTVSPSQLNTNSWLIACLMFLMTVLWLFQLIPMSITALLPIIIVPVLSDINIVEVVKPYSNSVIFLLLGGFIIAQGLEMSNLHKRIALKILLIVGSEREKILLGFIISTAFLSMWLSNTATCLLMIPIASTLLLKINTESDTIYKKILFLSIAYSSSIGGMGTLIGTAPNAMFAAFLNENFNIVINFIDWMLFSIPLIIILLGLYWFFIIKLLKKQEKAKTDKNFLEREYLKLGKLNFKEKIAGFIILLTANLWIFKPFLSSFFNLSISDSSIAIFGAFLFFIIPYKGFDSFILDKKWFEKIPWNILLLFGGGLALASLVTSSGLADWISGSLYFLNSYDYFIIIISLALLISFLTEVTSNTATTVLFLPIIAAFAQNNGFNLIEIILPIIFAASFAFMMPIATPPNAIIFATNEINVSFMAKIGIFLNIIAVIISCSWIYFFGNFLN